MAERRRAVHSPLVCTPKRLPENLLIPAAEVAARVNPLNHAPLERLARVMRGFAPSRKRIAVLTTKYWGTRGVRLGVAFLDGPESALRRRILQHLNAWGKTANVKFVESSAGGAGAEVRIARLGGVDGGYWSYVGTDILSIAPGEPTMNLEAFTMSTSESEFVRVVRHEAGHTLGFPHEHMRRQLVNKIDPRKAIAYFGRTQGWSPDEVRAQVLTPIEDGSLLGTPDADPNSIMCYQIPGTITKDGRAITGGADINDSDFAFAAKIYPKKPAAPPPRDLPEVKVFHSALRMASRRHLATVGTAGTPDS
ncbi:MAG TPA: hypothetical protein VGR35_03210 [Tepidisphaeraceae bacterium]|nr:hypothetical protein [Tepidisphaeraceae bacterium]